MTMNAPQFARRFPTRAAAALTLLAIGSGTVALAQAPAVTAAHASAPALSIRQIYDLLETAGYRDIRGIERECGRYKVKARNAQDERIKLNVNAATGAVERTRAWR